MTNLQIKSYRGVEMQRGAVNHNNVSEIDEPSLGEAKRFVTFIGEASWFVRAFHIKSKSKIAKLQRAYVV